MRFRLIPTVIATLLILTATGCATGNKKSLLEYDYPPAPPGMMIPYPYYPGPDALPGTFYPYPPYLYPYFYP